MIAHTFCEAYGWKPKDLLEFTPREIQFYSKQITRSKTESAKFEAALHGRELDLPSDNAINEIPKESREKLDERMHKLAKRIKENAAKK